MVNWDRPPAPAAHPVPHHKANPDAAEAPGLRAGGSGWGVLSGRQ
jgi:hypothetical protein